MTRQSYSPKVSVITPLYNSSRYVQGTLNSLCRQSYENWEAILVNDGSTDDTADKVKPYLADHRFKYLEQANGGIAAARNMGVTSASGEWVCLLDHDDRWLPTKLHTQVAFANDNQYDIVCTDAIAVQPRSRRLYSQFYSREFIEELRRSGKDANVDVFELLIRHNFLCASSVMLRRSLFDKVGLFDTDAAPADDYDMWLRCMPEARLGYLTEALIEYHIHTGNLSHDFTGMVQKTIFVLHKGADRHRNDRCRIGQFEDSLVTAYRTLFTEFLETRRYDFALRHAASLVARRRRGFRLLYQVADRGLLTALRKSFASKSTRRRSVYGERNLDASSDSDVS